ncbi:NAD(P)H-binding protein [Sphingomonas colocasiae]|uniref:NAD(P)H-binding protein n=1 Tax=Sphingomonas colocasiae TaxID=1848973 RepID=A0ABS7PHV8_9SPHN|nr:NAD(P)H-binding protein [Sphingomonas colocasiae]MBY8820884.1 NAD(P)H-binding protein [Sphingomonas colocasiae]
MKTILILGATGGVGGETAAAMLRHGWRVRAMARTVPQAAGDLEWVRGDALERTAVLDAARDVDAILHAVNPPGYRDWDRLVMPMIENSITAARASGARLALPGTIYNYDPRETPVARPDSSQRPNTHKGRIRAAMEQRIAESGVRAIILRAGNFFGPRPGNNWLSQAMVKPGQPVRSILNPATPGVGHAWAYLPDLAETFARLLDREAVLPHFARYHFAGTWDADGMLIADAIRGASQAPSLPVRRMPWALLRLIGLFNVSLRETARMRQFWRHPLALDNESLVAEIGAEPHTPLDQAMTATLAALGCLPATTANIDDQAA